MTALSDGEGMMKIGARAFYALVYLFAIGLLLFQFIPSQTSSAAAFVVSKTADTNDGICNADCSLREAITAANATVDADTITFNAAVFDPGTITLISSLPQISQDLTISGSGDADQIVIDGAEMFRVFTVAADVSVLFQHLTIARGETAGSGGGMIVAGNATLTSVAMTENHSPNGGGAIHVSNGGELGVDASTLWSNSGLGGAIHIEFGGRTFARNSTFTLNHSSASGGAILNNGFLACLSCTVSGNDAVGPGGGIRSNNTEPRPDELYNSIIAGNTAPSSFDLVGSFTSFGNNVVGNGGMLNTSPIFPSNPDLTGAAASPLNLGALADNGGPTLTMALGAGSVAIDHPNSYGAFEVYAGSTGYLGSLLTLNDQ
jgi:CSLREA domain-containing protein